MLVRNGFALALVTLIVVSADPQVSHSDTLERAEALTSALRDSAEEVSTAQETTGATSVLEIARHRQMALLELMESDPSAVLRLALPSGMEDTLPSAVEPYLERRFNTEGSLQVLIEDWLDHVVTHYQLVVAGDRYTLHFAGDPPNLASGSRVLVEGIAIDEHVALDATGDTPGTHLGVIQASTLPPTTGAKSIVALLINFQDDSSEPITLQEAHNILFDDPNKSVDAYYQEVSYGQTSFNGTVVDWFTVSTNSSCDLLGTHEAIAAADDAIDFSAFDHIMYIFPKPSGGCEFRGKGSVGETNVSTDDGVVSVGVSWILLGLGAAESRLAQAHELGHNLGLLHAHLLECPAGIIDDGCTRRGGDLPKDPFDLMSATSGGHFSALNKVWLGWFQSPSNVAEVDLGGGSFSLAALEQSTGELQALKVLRSVSPTVWYYIEHREQLGIDSFIGDDAVNGVLVRIGQECITSSACETDLLVFPGITTDLGELTSGSSMLLDGSTPLVLEVGSRDPVAGSIDVTLRFAEEPQFFPPVGVFEVPEGILLRIAFLARDLQGGVITYSLEPNLPTGAVFAPLGDADGDGILSLADRTEIESLLGRPVTSASLAVADMNGDDQIDDTDRAALNQVLADPSLQRSIFAWIPDAHQAGDYSVTVTALDQDGFSAVQDAEFTVTNAPVFDPVGNQTVTPGDVVSFPVFAADDRSEVSYVPVIFPDGAFLALAGDVTLDGNVDQVDQDICEDFVAGEVVPTPVELAVLDANGDGTSDAVDCLLITLIVKGLLPAERRVFVWEPTQAQVGTWFAIIGAINQQGVFAARSLNVQVTVRAQKIEHFLSYRAKTTSRTPRFLPLNVNLTDRFEAGMFTVRRLRAVALPANKNGEGIADADTHLISYEIRAMAGQPRHVNQRGLQVANQFGVLSLDTMKPRRLLVPTALDTDSPIDALDSGTHSIDHYKCYKVRVSTRTPRFPRGVQAAVTDQFEDRLYDVRKPSHLCMAVDKNGEGIKNPDEHLLCYQVKRAKGQVLHQRRQGIHVNNQFGPLQLDTKREEELCVPSTVR
jgi:M6 family metalloprotease-like protein